MARAPSYTPAQEVEVSTLARAGKTLNEIMEATGLSQGVVQGIKRKAGLVEPRGTRGPRQGVARKRADGVDSQISFLNLSAFTVEEEEEETEGEALLTLREELTNLQREKIGTARKLSALTRAEAWWKLRIVRVTSGDEDPGSVPPDDWTGEVEEEEAPSGARKRGSKKR